MFQLQCKPLRDLYTRCGRGNIPTPAWNPVLSEIFSSLKESITSSPLLARFDATKPLFLKTDWSAIGMGYLLMQPDDSEEGRTATTKLLSTEKCDFDCL